MPFGTHLEDPQQVSGRIYGQRLHREDSQTVWVKIQTLPPGPRPHLALLLAAYLADGAAYYPNVWEAVARFRVETPPEFARAAVSELRELMRAGSDEASLAAAADAMGCDYNPTGDGMSYHDFLTGIERMLATPPA